MSKQPEKRKSEAEAEERVEGDEEEEDARVKSVSGPKVPKGARDTHPEQMAIREKAFQAIKNVFLRHGAVGIDTPVFERKETLTNKYGEDSKLIYDLADQGGELLSLRYDLTVPFARYIACYKIKKIKRYHIARVYRRDNPAMNRGRFREFYQCDFDIAGENEPMVTDAEVLKVLCEVLEDLKIGNYKVKVNHRKLIDAVMSVCGVPPEKFRAICSAIDKLDKEPWDKVRDEMVKVKHLDEAVADKIGTYVTQKPGDPVSFLTHLRKDAGLSENKSAKEAFSDLELLFKYLEWLGCLSHMSFDLSLARGLDYYTGVIYEAMLTDSDRVGSIAAGGRYDNLVGMFSGVQIPAVGVSVGIERILALLEEQEAKRSEAERTRKTQTQVLVCSIGKNMLAPRMELCSELWRNNIRAEFFYHANPKPDKQLHRALEDGIPYAVWIGESEVQQGVVKVKTISARTEAVVPRKELVSHLKKLLQEPSDSIPAVIPSAGAVAKPAISPDVIAQYERRAAEAERKIAALNARLQEIERVAFESVPSSPAPAHEAKKDRSKPKGVEEKKEGPVAYQGPGHHHYRGCPNDNKENFLKKDCECDNKCNKHMSFLMSMQKETAVALGEEESMQASSPAAAAAEEDY